MLRWKLLRILIASLSGMAFLRFCMDTFRRPDVPVYGSHLTNNYDLDPNAVEGGRQKLVIILPIDKPLHDLCKVVSSAIALGYPPPVLVNWRKEFNTDEAGIGPSHLAKVDGTLEFLEYALHNESLEADRLHENDLVLMLDALDVWFQLPPVVLLRRYYAIIQAASSRAEAESGFSDPSWMRQRLVAAAQKPCDGPRDDVSDLHCDQLPESSLPDDIYGIFTDSTVMELRSKWKRPASLNSGSFLGPASDMRRFFLRVKEKMDNIEEMGVEIGGDQAVFASVYGEQEKWRRELQARHGEGDRAAERNTAQQREHWDFGLTLDYTQELFYPTGYSEYDGGFYTFNDEETELRRSREMSDFDEARSLLMNLRSIPEEDCESKKLPLFVDYWTGAVPAVLHHNAWRSGLKQRRKEWWDKMWYFPYLRLLLESHSDAEQQVELAPLMTLPANNGTLEVWPYRADKQRGSRKCAFILETNEVKKKEEEEEGRIRPADWEEICKFDDAEKEERETWFEEVFQDGGGPMKR